MERGRTSQIFGSKKELPLRVGEGKASVALAADFLTKLDLIWPSAVAWVQLLLGGDASALGTRQK